MDLLTGRGVAPAERFLWSRFVTQAFRLSTNDHQVALPAAALLLTLVLITLPSGAVSG
jgi:hypothetical protein